jgi:hypothetical protein
MKIWHNLPSQIQIPLGTKQERVTTAPKFSSHLHVLLLFCFFLSFVFISSLNLYFLPSFLFRSPIVLFCLCFLLHIILPSHSFRSILSFTIDISLSLSLPPLWFYPFLSSFSSSFYPSSFLANTTIVSWNSPQMLLYKSVRSHSAFEIAPVSMLTSSLHISQLRQIM